MSFMNTCTACCDSVNIRYAQGCYMLHPVEAINSGGGTSVWRLELDHMKTISHDFMVKFQVISIRSAFSILYFKLTSGLTGSRNNEVSIIRSAYLTITLEELSGCNSEAVTKYEAGPRQELCTVLIVIERKCDN